MMYGFERGYGHGHIFVGGLIMMVIVILLAILAAFIIIKHHRGMRHYLGAHHVKTEIDVSSTKRALEILNEKFALGEITEEEYLRKKELIKS